MHHQHNPIAQRIDDMRKVWHEKVTDQTVLVRWLLKPEESRMYEGFCRLESSPYGALNELFLFFYTPFEDIDSFSRHVMVDWLKEIKTNTELKASVSKAGIDIDNWDFRKFDLSSQQQRNCNYDQLLIDMMASYLKLLKQDDVPLVLSLLPKQINSTGGFANWLQRMMQQNIPDNLRFLVLDHAGSNHWGGVFEAHKAKAVTLHHDLRLDEAMRQIATGGDSRSPEVQFRKCMYAMGDAAQKNQVDLLHSWGKKAIEVGTKSGLKNLLATAYITYAGMLFSFKQHETIQSLLDSGIRICKRELASGDDIMKPLLLQFYGFKAADFQHQKNTHKAFDLFLLQGSEAYAFQLYAQSVSGYYKAFLLAQYKSLAKEQVAALTAALTNTPYLHLEEIKSSEYAYVAYEYHQLQQHKTPGTDMDTAALADQRMQEVFGIDWKSIVENLKQNFNRRHIQQTEAGASVG